MNTLLLATLLTATTVAHVSHDTDNDRIKYQIVANEYGHSHNYAYVGTKIEETRQYLVYNMNMEACNKHSTLRFNIIDEKLTSSHGIPWGLNPVFTFKKDLFNYRCFLTVRKSPKRGVRYYDNIYHDDHWRILNPNYGYNHHYDNHNHHRAHNHYRNNNHSNKRNVVVVRPNNSNSRVIVRPNNSNTRVVVRPNSNSRVIVRDRGNNRTRVIVRDRQNNSRTRVIVRPRNVNHNHSHYKKKKWKHPKKKNGHRNHWH